jgi:alpha-tubulin suppressor-like RCC1 family protein
VPLGPFVALLATILLGLGCSNHTPFACSSSSQCVTQDKSGVCTEGYCAFADPGCAGGYRFEPNAGGGLGGTCLMVDASIACGAIGQACCAGDTACVAGSTCDGGTCQACVADVALGRRFSCTLAPDHSVWCSGDNSQGQLALGLAGVPSPTPVQARDTSSTAITDAIALGAGRDHGCAVRSGGTVWCWGANGSGEVGNGSAAPNIPAAVQVIKSGNTPLTDIVEVAAGNGFTCARDSAGGLWCWGDNSGGALGDGTTTTRTTAAPVLVAMGGAPFIGAAELEIGDTVACTRKSDGVAWCWGRNANGQFGDTTKTDHPVPVMVATTASVAPGMRHMCFVDSDSSISCMGSSDFSRLGTGSGGGFNGGGDQVTPVHVVSSVGGPPFTGVARVYAGGESCAIMQDTSVYCWGDNRYGEIGTGQGSTVPVQVRVGDQPLDHVDRLVTHYAHVCAHRTSGEWLCWGRNSEGELGDGTILNRGFPTPIKGSCQ